MSHLEVKLFGGFSVVYAAQPVDKLNANRLQSLLTYILVNRQSPQPRQQIAADLWPETTDKQARTNLRNLIFQLRSAFPQIESYLHLERKSIQWRTELSYSLDIEEFETLLELSIEPAEEKSALKQHGQDGEARLSRLRRAIELYQGDLVLTLYDEWMLSEREKFKTLYRDALVELTVGLESERQYSDAIVIADKLLLVDPLQESTYRQLMRLHALNDDRGAALRIYQKCEETLRQELDVEPSLKTVALKESLVEASIAVGVGIPVIPLRPEDTLDHLIDDEAQHAHDVLVGRHQEWTMLKEAWSRTENGHSHCVVIRGEAGIGKTRLAEELASWIQRQGFSATMSHCYTAQQSLPYSPVITWLRSHAFQSTLTDIDETWLAEASRILPELAQGRRLWETVTPVYESWQRRHLFDALIQIVHSVRQPLLFVVDDAQWADIESLEWLQTLLRENQTTTVDGHQPTPVLIVCTLRTEESDTTSFLKSWSNDLKRNGLLTITDLGPLTPEETLALGSSVADKPLSQEDGTKLFGQTEGHPLFIVESVRAGFIHGSLMGLGPVVPETNKNSRSASLMIQSVIDARLQQLGDSTRSILNLASVIGREFDYDILNQASSAEEEIIVDALDEALQRGIIREQGTDAYDFSHGQLRQAVYDGLSNARRRLYHKKLATVLEDYDAIQIDSMAGQLALHYELGGVAEKAIDYYLRAAVTARKIYANEDAVNHYQHILSSTLAHKLTAEKRCEILLAAGHIWFLIGEWQDATSHYNELLALAEELGNEHYQAQSRLGLANVMRRQGLHSEALKHLETAKSLFEKYGDQLELAQTLDTLGDFHWNMGNHVKAQEMYEQQQMLSDLIGSESIQCRARLSLGRIYWLQGQPSQALPLCQDAFQIAEAEGLVLEQARSSLTIGGILGRNGDYDGAWSWTMKSLTLAQQMGHQELVTHASQNISTICNLYGDFQLSIKCACYALINTIKIRDVRSSGFLLNNLGDKCVIHEEFDLAQKLLYRSQQIFLRLNWSNYLLGVLGTLSALYIETEQYEQLEVLEQDFAQLFEEVGQSSLNDANYATNHRVMVARLQLAKGAQPDVASNELKEIILAEQLKPEPDEDNMANLHYQIWRIDPTQSTHRDEATQRYLRLHQQRPSIRYRKRYHELTGDFLPEPPPLTVPDVFIQHNYDFVSVLAQLDQWLSELTEQVDQP